MKALVYVLLLGAAGCGSIEPEPLMGGAVLIAPPALPKGALFGTHFALAGDLLVVNAQSGGLFAEPGAWTGAIVIYRRVAGKWVQEGHVESSATWMIASQVYISGDEILMVAPFDGRCPDARGRPQAQSGSVMVLAREQGWRQVQWICAPEPKGNASFGWVSAQVQDGLLVSESPPLGAESLVRINKQRSWAPTTDLVLEQSDFTRSMSADDAHVLRGHEGMTGWEIEVRSAARPSNLERTIACISPGVSCRAWPMAERTLLISDDGMAEFIRDSGERAALSLNGVGRIVEVTGRGHRAAILDDQGQLYIIDGPTAEGTIAPSLKGLCSDGIAAATLSGDAAVVACLTSREVWVTPLPAEA